MTHRHFRPNKKKSNKGLPLLKGHYKSREKVKILQSLIFFTCLCSVWNRYCHVRNSNFPLISRKCPNIYCVTQLHLQKQISMRLRRCNTPSGPWLLTGSGIHVLRSELRVCMSGWTVQRIIPVRKKTLISIWALE